MTKENVIREGGSRQFGQFPELSSFLPRGIHKANNVLLSLFGFIKVIFSF